MIQAKIAHHLMQEENIESYSMERDSEYYYQTNVKRLENGIKACCYAIAAIIILIVFSLLLSSCKSIQYVPVEKVVTEYKTNTVHDSVYLEILKHDSVVIEKLGDTVYVNKWHTQYKDRWKEVIKTDTFIKVDSIQVPYPVEKKLTRWEQTKMDAGGIAIGLCFAFIIFIIVGFIVRVRKKT